MTILAGTKLCRYEIRSRIGKGGMGEVYLALDTELDRKVALKVLPAEVASDQSRMSRFMKEAKAASTLNHPNILTVYEIGRSPLKGAGEITFICTEYIEGRTLRERMQGGAMSQGEALEYSTQIASALSAAHAAGIVHRDIKPENVMLRPDGIAKVVDFGLAKYAERDPEPAGTSLPTSSFAPTDTGVVLGTVRYMSPEQARGIPVDARTDIFSLGVVIYEMMAGRLPFDGMSTNEILVSILSDREPPPLSRYVPDAPAEFDRILSRALRKDREERYQTVKDMLLDLKNLKQELEFARKQESSAPRAGASDALRIESPVAARTATAQIASAGSRFGIRSLAGAIAALLLIAGIGYRYFHRRPDQETIDSIAVLPFENVTHDQKTEYLSDGITESLINSLSKLPHVRVIARSSVFSYKNQTLDLQEVAARLNVQSVLTGRVLLQGDTLDVQVELTDVKNDTHLWGDHYPRKVSDIFAVQDEIALQVTDALRVRLSGEQQLQIGKRYTQNAEAYRLYLQGLYLFNQGSEEDFSKAVSFFDQAIQLDPRFALAYAERAYVVSQMGDLNLSMHDAMRKAKQDAGLALSIDSKLPEARMAQALIEFSYDWDFSIAESDFRQATVLDPNYAEAHHQLMWYYALMGRPMDGLSEIRLAQQLDPVNPSIVVDTCVPFYLSRQYDEAIAHLRKAIIMFPNFFLPHMAIGDALIQKHETTEGLEQLKKAAALEPSPLVLGSLGQAYALSGRREEALKVLAQLQEESGRRYVSPYWIAIIYAGLGQKDEAFGWLEKAYKERSFFFLWLKTDPKVDPLRSDPRFNELMRHIPYPQ